MAYQPFTHQIWWVMVCYDLAHQIRCAKHTFSGWCDIPPMVCYSFGGHSTPHFLQCNHVKLSHCGPTLLSSHVGELYHVTGARQLARTICKGCVVCKKAAAKVQNQLMGQLPASRTTASPPFTTTGIDYAGPFTLKRGHT